MKLVSIIGDSISTYEGFNPKGYEVFYDKEMQLQNGLSSVDNTWWAIVNRSLHAHLCVNNSYSGSRVTGIEFPAASSEERTAKLHTAEYSPDLILVYVGFNDFGNGIKVKNTDRGYLAAKNLTVFSDAYEYMVTEVKNNYPKANIVCGTLMRTQIREWNDWVFPEAYAGVAFEEYNITIRQICKKKNCYLADLGTLGWRYETLDGTHPTAEGHAMIANAWVKCLERFNL